MSFAVWLTGPPGAGKSTIARALVRRGFRGAVLESDLLRSVLTPKPRYDDEEREVFYGALVWIGSLLVRHGVPVIFDATAQRRAWRDRARGEIPNFFEVHVDCPLELRAARDPKGLYRAAAEGKTSTLPGLQSSYEPPEKPELVVHTERESAEAAAGRILEALDSLCWRSR